MSYSLKSTQAVPGSKILALGAKRASEIVDNNQLVEKIDSSDEWIQQRTGIVTRHRALKDTSVLDLAEAAAKDAISRAKIDPSTIDTIIVSTVTFPYSTPSLAAALSDLIGAGSAASYDISAACAGYCYGIAQADSFIRSGTSKTVLVVGAEKLSDFIDDTERSISFLLGDGAGAALVTASNAPQIGTSVWGSDGSKWDAIGMTHSLLDVKELSDTAKEANTPLVELPQEKAASLWPTLRQDGQSVFRWAVWEMAHVCQKIIAAAGVSTKDISAFIPHQANMRIVDALKKQVGLSDDVKIARDIAETGNTSSASVPLATEKLLEKHPELEGKLALQVGFGAGLVYAGQVVVLPSTSTPSEG